MKILYVVHAAPWVEFSGTPLIAGQYAKAAVRAGYSVAIMTPGVDHLPVENIGEWEGIRVLSWQALPEWPQMAFSRMPADFCQPNSVSWPYREFLPDIVHIIDWVGISPSLLHCLKTLNIPILRHVWNFEDFCQFIEPIHKNHSGTACPAPLSPASCAECISQRSIVAMKSGQITLANLMQQVQQVAQKNYSQAMQSTTQRKLVVRQHLNYYYDHLLFASNSFFEYWRNFVSFDTPCSIINHGCEVKTVPRVNGAVHDELRCIYVGGSNYRKGWDVIESVFDNLIFSGVVSIKLRIYGNKLKTQNSRLAKYSEVEFFDEYSPGEIANVFSWADVGIVPTRFETYCRVVREMMLCGVVPIASPAFGISDVLVNGINGILIDPEKPDSLIIAVKHLFQDRERLQKMRENARQSTIQSPDDEYRAIKSLYQALIKNAS
ncbi:hypothetical protein PHIN6_07840 [Polynucleobacter sp. HIN6]|uniref:glycosyltransferase n=1 Tax=Polynucleobacter sp. HIN6 TaxID=3047865 RepID=UPI002572D3F7|nr:glycosyltransferase [Polynucleobacter sp. HIN6]BEI35266.1 hypothetical protein PHIN6_07840 [Polynucleobacter sp. HIN6]